MKLFKIGHSCVAISTGDTTVVVDPGIFTAIENLENIQGVDALFITHNHSDHISEKRVEMLRRNNPEMVIYTNAETGVLLDEMRESWSLMEEGSKIQVGEIVVKAWEVDHHPIHADVPVVRNLCLLFNDTFFHPGDALFVPPVPVPVLGMPFGPFASFKECFEYGIKVAPKRIIPLHDGYMTVPNPYVAMPNHVWPKYDINYEYVAAGETVEM